MDQTIRLCFELGMSHSEILFCLAQLNGIVISQKSLKRALKRMKLFRRKNYSEVVDVALFLINEVQCSGQMLGYKLMHLKCLQNGFVVTQEHVRELLHIVDPEGIQLRRKRRLRRRAYHNIGPNFLWHIDSYDKLKPYGLCINGCIDGFSRYIVWLEVHRTSSDPRVIGSYFIEAVKKHDGCPTRLTTDKGTENGHILQMQQFLRKSGRDQYADSPCVVGSSNHNQRIEQWWGFLRKENVQYWMNLFKMMKDMSVFTGDFIDKALVQFCFMQLIQEELDAIVNLWNSHRIRPSKNPSVPSGRPAIMFSCPSVYGAVDHLQHVSNNEILVCLEECTPKGHYTCDETVYELSQLLMEEAGREMPTCGEEAVLLYEYLRNGIINGLKHDTEISCGR